MKNTARVVVWIAAFGGGGLLFWKGWQGMVLFLFDLVEGTLSVEAAESLASILPDYGLAVLGLGLLAVAQVIAIWQASPAKRVFTILQGSLLLLGGLIGLRAIMGVAKAFSVLASTASSGASPDVLLANLSGIQPGFYVSIALIVLSTLFACLSVDGSGGSRSGIAMKLLSSAGWLLVVIALVALAGPFAAIQYLLANVGGGGAADPAELAQLISRILAGERLVMVLLFLLGIAALILGLMNKSTVAESAPGEGSS